MDDSTSLSPRQVSRLNRLAVRVFALKVRKGAATTRLNESTKRNKATLERVSEQFDTARAQLLAALKATNLLDAEHKSFATLIAVFLTKSLPITFKVTDPAGALQLAKKLGITHLIAKRKVTYVIDPAMIQEYLEQHPDHAERFIPFLRMPGYRTWYGVRPNDAYLTTLDASRLTNEATPLTDS